MWEKNLSTIWAWWPDKFGLKYMNGRYISYINQQCYNSQNATSRCFVHINNYHVKLRPHWGFSARLQYLQCISNEDITILHLTIDKQYEIQYINDISNLIIQITEGTLVWKITYLVDKYLLSFQREQSVMQIEHFTPHTVLLNNVANVQFNV